MLFSANVSLAAAHGSVQPTDGTPLSQVLVRCRRPQITIRERSTMETMKLRAIQLPGNAGELLDSFIRVEVTCRASRIR